MFHDLFGEGFDFHGAGFLAFECLFGGFDDDGCFFVEVRGGGAGAGSVGSHD